MTEQRGDLAFLFPGQGSQFVGMGKDLYEMSAAARRIFQEAEEALGISLHRLCFEGPEDELNDTINTQPAVVTASIACLAALRERWGPVEPRYVAGHSLGEYSALVAANVLRFVDAMSLVRERGRLMKEAGQVRPGGMAAILGLADAAVRSICEEASARGVVVPANFNSPCQIVISGEVGALEEALRIAQEQGAKRARRLAVSIAAHSPLMAQAAERFNSTLARVSLADARVPLVANVGAEMITTAADIRQELEQQLCQSVLWTQSVRRMAERGASTFVEIGPGNVLAGLVKRIAEGAATVGIGDARSVEEKGALLTTAS